MRVRWRNAALDDLQAFHDWLAAIERANSDRVIQRIRAAADSMKRFGDIGRPGAVEGVRELSVRNAPYVIVYAVEGDLIEIIAINHTAQDR